MPIGCRHDLTFMVELVSKTTEAKFTNDNKFNQQTTVVPSFLAYNSATNFTIKGSNYLEGRNTYQFRVTAIESTDTSIRDNSFLLAVATLIDCVTYVVLSLPDSFSKEITYQIGKAA